MPFTFRVLIEGEAHKAILVTPKDIGGGLLRIQSCRKAEIYILAPIAHVSISDCTNCIIVIGATERSIVVKNCKNVNLITACGSLTVWYVLNSSVF